MAILIDTCVFVAISNKRDVNHSRAKDLIRRCADLDFGKPYTSDYIFDETVTTVFARTKDHKKSLELGEFILGSELEMLRVDQHVFESAWELYKRYEFSFTDCSSLALLKLYGIKKLMTFDRDFRKVDWVEIVD